MTYREIQWLVLRQLTLTQIRVNNVNRVSTSIASDLRSVSETLGIESWPPTDPNILSVLGIDQAKQLKRLNALAAREQCAHKV